MANQRYTVKSRYLIRGPNRTKFQHYWVAGRGWTKEWIEVGVVVGDENPVEVYEDRSTGVPVKRTRPILNLINEKQLKQILADDKNMAVRSIDEGTGEARDQKVDVLALMQENEELKKAALKHKAEVDQLRTKLAEANAMLDDATKPAAALAAKVAARRAKAAG
jgi:hypothetical protein